MNAIKKYCYGMELHSILVEAFSWDVVLCASDVFLHIDIITVDKGTSFNI